MGKSSRDRDKYSRERHRDKDRDKDRRRRSRSRSRSKSYYSSSSRSKKSSKKSYRRSSSSSSSDGSSRSMRSMPRALSTDKYTVISSTSTAAAPQSKPLKSLEILENRLTSTVLGSIEEDTFTSQAFVSGGAKKVTEKVYINLNNETMAIPVPEEKISDTTENLNFNPQFLGDEQTKMDKWVKKLYNYRKREAFL